MSMPRTYILFSEVEMLENRLGLLHLSKFVKPGGLLLLTLWVMPISGQIRLRIYRESNTLLLDILASTSVKVVAACPQRDVMHQPHYSELNGAEWLEQYLPQSASVPLVSPSRVAYLGIVPKSWEEWMNLLQLELSGIGKQVISFSQLAQVRGWSEFSKSVVDVYQSRLSRVDCASLYDFFKVNPLYCKDSLQPLDSTRSASGE